MRIDVGQAGSNSWASRQISANISSSHQQSSYLPSSYQQSSHQQSSHQQSSYQQLSYLHIIHICESLSQKCVVIQKCIICQAVVQCIWIKHCVVLDLSMSSILSQSKVFAKHGKVGTGELGGRGKVGISVPVACFQHQAFNMKITTGFLSSLS